MTPEEDADGAFEVIAKAIEGDGPRPPSQNSSVVLRVVDYQCQRDFKAVKPRQNWTLDEYEQALRRFRAKCEQRGWLLEAIPFQENAYRSWKAESRLTVDDGPINVFLLHILGIPNAKPFERADGICPVVAAITRPKSWGLGKKCTQIVLPEWQPESSTPVDFPEEWTSFEIEVHNSYIVARDVEHRVKIQPLNNNLRISETTQEVLDQRGNASWSFKRIGDLEVVWTLHACGSGLFGADNYIKLRGKYLVSPVLGCPNTAGAANDVESQPEKEYRRGFNIFGWRFSLAFLPKRKEKRPL